VADAVFVCVAVLDAVCVGVCVFVEDCVRVLVIVSVTVGVFVPVIDGDGVGTTGASQHPPFNAREQLQSPTRPAFAPSSE
jgi:hypothetical protein